jgi:hypothetical protein
MKKKRTLYECSHALVKDKRIYCDRGYPLSHQPGDGSLDVQNLAEGKPLAPKVCRQCGDFDSMGLPIPEEERGWLKINAKEVKGHDEIDWEPLRKALA